jgi:predicted component of type VI protein secretion system
LECIDKLLYLARQLKASASFTDEAKKFLGEVADLLIKEESYEKLKAELETGNFLKYIDKLLK